MRGAGEGGGFDVRIRTVDGRTYGPFCADWDAISEHLDNRRGLVAFDGGNPDVEGGYPRMTVIPWSAVGAYEVFARGPY